jgi:uncharacterized protein
MRWRRGPRSKNLRDERGGPQGGGGLGGLGGGGLSIPGGVGKVGLPIVIVTVVVIVLLNALGGGGGFDVPGLSQFTRAPVGQGTGIPPDQDPDANMVDFVSFLLDDVQSMWADEFRSTGEGYRDAMLVLFEQATDTGCGSATSEVGPFYCPADQTVYLDLGFFRELRDRFAAPGDFAQAYVVAHELGHHVQKLLGISDQVDRLTRQHPDDQNDLSIRLELQADCFAGVWGFTANERGMVVPGDLKEALDAAEAVGDDRLQKEATGHINRETWTHGSSQQRETWFSKGFDSGDPNQCDTFSGSV